MVVAAAEVVAVVAEVDDDGEQPEEPAPGERASAAHLLTPLGCESLGTTASGPTPSCPPTLRPEAIFLI